MTQIKRWNDGKIICEGESDIKTLAENNTADLFRANLSGANLSGADLSRADLSEANLFRADLSWADLSGAKNIEFYLLPSIRILSSIQLNDLPDNLQTELMRRDAAGHPHPEKFDEWANHVHNGNCPYENEERFWLFEPKKTCWIPGSPTMSDVDLIIAICKSQGWKIRGYLK